MKPAGGEKCVSVSGATLCPGVAAGRLLRLDEPLSFWGGVDPQGRVSDIRHPQHGTSLRGTVLVMPAGRGSSSSAAVFAEQIRAGAAPAAVILAEPDGILVAGALAAAELYGIEVPVLTLSRSGYDCLAAAVPTEGPGDLIAQVRATSPTATVTVRGA